MSVCPPCSRAAAAVITLAVLAVSNTFVTGMSVVAVRLAGRAGLNDGAWASARLCPVLGCMTTTVQLSAWTLRTCAAQACSASYWMSAWMVRRTPPPGTAGRVLSCPTGIGWPSVSVSTTLWPSRPGRAEQVSRIVGVGEADDVRSEISVGVCARVCGVQDDARLIERGDAGRDGR